MACARNGSHERFPPRTDTREARPPDNHQARERRDPANHAWWVGLTIEPRAEALLASESRARHRRLSPRRRVEPRSPFTRRKLARRRDGTSPVTIVSDRRELVPDRGWRNPSRLAALHIALASDAHDPPNGCTRWMEVLHKVTRPIKADGPCSMAKNRRAVDRRAIQRAIGNERAARGRRAKVEHDANRGRLRCSHQARRRAIGP